jgi:hypothetical protein
MNYYIMINKILDIIINCYAIEFSESENIQDIVVSAT